MLRQGLAVRPDSARVVVPQPLGVVPSLGLFLAEAVTGRTLQPHLGQASSLTPAILIALKAELAKGDRTWNARQIAAWVAEQHGVSLSLRQLARRLKGAGLSYKRTYRSLKHKQDPDQVTTKQADLQTLKKGEPLG